jgi:hypothetical protein
VAHKPGTAGRIASDGVLREKRQGGKDDESKYRVRSKTLDHVKSFPDLVSNTTIYNRITDPSILNLYVVNESVIKLDYSIRQANVRNSKLFDWE